MAFFCVMVGHHCKGGTCIYDGTQRLKLFSTFKGEILDTEFKPLRCWDLLEGKTRPLSWCRCMSLHVTYCGTFQVFLTGNEWPEIVPKLIHQWGQPVMMTTAWIFVFTRLTGHQHVAIKSRICQIEKHFAADEKIAWVKLCGLIVILRLVKVWIVDHIQIRNVISVALYSQENPS